MKVRGAKPRWNDGRVTWAMIFPLLMGLSSPTAWAESRQVVAGPEYEQSGWHTFWWGKGYRNVWSTPIEVEVLDLQHEAGGLEVVRRVGGRQTPGLALKGADGKAYTFRSIRKDMTIVLPPEWQNTIAAEVLQDQNAARHPGAFPFMNGMAEPFPWAVQPPQRLVVMPDDPILGEHREVFADRLGTFGEFPLPATDDRAGFLGATEILSSKDLWARWLEGPDNRIDTALFLRYRIADLWTGNSDRHSKQWRWARLPGNDHWRPIAEDPDMVFANYQGVLLALARGRAPNLLPFQDKIGPMAGMTMNGADIDRWVLTDLDKDAFLQAAREMRNELTDEKIDDALRTMPPEWYAINGTELGVRLRNRRDNLEEGVERYYMELAREVNVHGTDRDEVGRIRRSEDGTVEVALGLEGAEPYYRRRFVPQETRSVRLYLHGGNDRVVSEGAPTGRIQVLVIGGPGDDVVDDRQGGGTRVYDAEGDNVVRKGKGTKLDARPWENPDPIDYKPWLEPRDHGHYTEPFSELYISRDFGLVLQPGIQRTTYGFRRFPYQRRHQMWGGVSTKRWRGEVGYFGSFGFVNSDLFLGQEVVGSQIENVNFFGFGNETLRDEDLDDDEFYEAEENQFRYVPSLLWRKSPQLDLFTGLEVKYASEDSTDTLLSQEQPFGSGDFGQVGLFCGLEWDSRKRTQQETWGQWGEGASNWGGAPPGGPEGSHRNRSTRTGLALRFEGSLFPEVWDVEETFGAIEGELAGTLGLGSRENIVLAAEMGGRTVWGDLIPWQESAFIGGRKTNRGFASQRFAGESSLFGRAEVRLHLWDALFILPNSTWIFGLADAGRVWVDGEDSDEWHPSYGGGIVIELQATPVQVRGQVARNEDEDSLRYYVRTGWAF